MRTRLLLLASTLPLAILGACGGGGGGGGGARARARAQAGGLAGACIANGRRHCGHDRVGFHASGRDHPGDS